MPYRQRIPRRIDDVAIDDGYYEPPIGNRSTVILLVIFLVIVVGFFISQNGGFRAVGTAWESRPIEWPAADAPIVEDSSVEPINERPIIKQPQKVRPQVIQPAPPRSLPEVAVITKPIPRPRRVPPIVRPSNDVVGYSWVTATSVNLRTGPGTEYDVVYLLPENWLVAIMSDSALDDKNEVWARVRVETNEGVKSGWLNRKYLSY